MITIKNVKIVDGIVYLDFTCDGNKGINKIIYNSVEQTLETDFTGFVGRSSLFAAIRLSKRYLSGELQWKDKDYVYMWY